MERTRRGLEIRGKDAVATRFAVYRFAAACLGWRYYQPGPLGLERLGNPPEPPPVRGARGVLLHERAGFVSRNLSGLGGEGARPDWRDWHGLRERFHYNHTLHEIVPPELFETRPEWFAKDAQGRPMRPPFPVAHGDNHHPDLSQEAVRDWVAERTLQAVAAATPFERQPADRREPIRVNGRIFPPVVASPGVLSVSVSLSDSFVFGSFDTSYPWAPRRYFRRWPDWSNHVFAYKNAVAERISAGWESGRWTAGPRPQLYLGALAYLNYENVPDFPLHPRIIPYLTYDRSQWHDPAARADDLDTVARWSRAGADFLGTWDYLFGYGFLIPRSLGGIVRDSLPALHALGVRAYFSQIGSIWPYDAHTTWLTARLLWNPTADPGALLDEFFAGFFGPAAPAMRAFFDTAERAWMNQEGPGVWLRYWKDPWQAALLDTDSLAAMERHLQDALQSAQAAVAASVAPGLPAGRFLARVRQTADVFAITRCLHAYQTLCWELQAADWRNAPLERLHAGLAAAEAALEQRERLAATVEAAAREHPLAARVRDLSWVFDYDVLGAAIAAIGLRWQETGPPDPAIAQRLARLLERWAQYHSLAGTRPDWQRPARPVLYDTTFAHIEDPRIWHHQFMDSAGMATAPAVEGAGFRVENARRGHIYQLFPARPGHWYMASVDVATHQSPSGEVTLRLDFFDEEHRPLTGSPRGRLAPAAMYGARQRLRALWRAPEGADLGRLLIRFYEMDPGRPAYLQQVRVLELPPAGSP